MSKYSSVLYGQGYYGQQSRLAFSVEPFTAVAVSYSEIILNWSAPLGGYTAFRIVRNQEGYSATVEDGAVIYEEFGINSSEAVSISTFTDTNVIDGIPALVNGRFVYYRIWLLKASDNVWYPAGDTYTLLPSEHPTFGPKIAHKASNEVLLTTHDKVMNLLPRVYTSISGSPLDAVDSNSDLYRFLKGFSFTMDEFLTMADSLLPDYEGHRTNPAAIAAQASQLGLTEEPYIALNRQKRIIREAIYIYSNKGSSTGIATLAESLTGYGSEITVSPNLMLSNQDATFYGGLGFWTPGREAELELEQSEPVTSESLSIDRTYCAKVTASNNGDFISNGADFPVTRGIPVQEGLTYGFSFYTKTSQINGPVSGGVVPSITWYDFTGAQISTSTGTQTVSYYYWAKPGTLFTATAPDGAAYASVQLTFKTEAIYYIDMVQFALEDVLDYHESRAAYIFLTPTKNNFIVNPSFELDTTGWTAVSGTVSRVSTDVPSQDLTGSHAMQIAAGTIEVTSSSTQGVVPVNSHAAFSAYLRTESGATESVDMTVTAVETTDVTEYSITDNVLSLNISFNESIVAGNEVTVSGIDGAIDGDYTVTAVSGGVVTVPFTHADVALTSCAGSISVSHSISKTVPVTDTWTRQYVTGYVPSKFDVTNTVVTVSLTGTTSHYIEVDAVQLEPKFTPTDYFDGDYGTERDAVWAGAANESASYLYANKIISVTRLAAELPDYLPQNTAFVISTYSGIEASGFTD